MLKDWVANLLGIAVLWTAIAVVGAALIGLFTLVRWLGLPDYWALGVVVIVFMMLLALVCTLVDGRNDG